jgi:hypothetical protein
MLSDGRLWHQYRACSTGSCRTGVAPCSSVLPVDDIVDLISQTCVETGDRICTPVVTLCTFWRHIHSDDPACRAAVARLHATRVAQGLEPCSPPTGGYGKARQRWAEALRYRLVPWSGHRLQQQPPRAWHWHGRAVTLVDGAGVSMPDTEATQQASPQPGSQKPGLGCPVARLVVVFSWACGAVVAAAVGRSMGPQSREPMLCHRLQASLERADVVLADRFSCSSWEVALWRGRGIDLVRRWHQRRPVDVRGGRRVGREDPVVSWPTPKRPAWLDEATDAGWPATRDRRVLRVGGPQRGCRTRVILVATTVLESQADPREDLAGLSRARWQAALARRAITQTMQMDVLRGKTPAMVRQASWGHLLVYNLLRAAMAQAAREHGVVPRQVSLQGTRQTLTAFDSLVVQMPSTARESRVSRVLSAIASHRVGTRPDRYEPRACQRRPKPYPLLRVPRPQARARLATAA